MNYEEIYREARAALAEANIGEDVPVAGGIRQLIKRTTDARSELEAARTAVPEAIEGDDLASRVTKLAAELERLRPLADDGRAYRSDLINEALAEGVRAYGENFAEETYRGLLEASGIEAIKRMRDDWRTVAGKQFPGGRQTVDEDENEGHSAGKREHQLPAAAHKA